MRERLERKVLEELVKGKKKKGGSLSQGEFIARLRKLKSWTQEKLAEKCEVSVKTVRNWENNGEVASSNQSMLFEALGITWKEFQERRILLDLSQGQTILTQKLLCYIEVLNPAGIWQELQGQRKELNGMLKVIDEHLKNIDMNKVKKHNVEPVEVSQREKLADIAWELDPDVCCDYVIERYFGSEQEFASDFYKNGEEYDSEIGLEKDKMDEEYIKAEIVYEENCSKENEIEKSFEHVKQLLEEGYLSESAVEELKASVKKTLQAVGRQEVALDVEFLQTLHGIDLALSCYSGSAD